MIDFTLIESDAEKVNFIQDLGRIIEKNEITPYKLNEALANYYEISKFLTTIYETVYIECEKIKTDFEVWNSEKFIECRDKINGNRITSKWASQTEIQSEIVNTYKDEYKQWRNTVMFQERRLSFYRRLSDSWKTYAQMLINLSTNMRSEMYALYVENQANKDIKQEQIHRRVKTVKS